MNKIIIVIMLLALSINAADTTGTWASAGGTRMDSLAAYAWNPAQPSAFNSNIILVFNSGSVNSTLGSSINIKQLAITSGYLGIINLQTFNIILNSTTSRKFYDIDTTRTISGTTGNIAGFLLSSSINDTVSSIKTSCPLSFRDNATVNNWIVYIIGGISTTSSFLIRTANASSSGKFIFINPTITCGTFWSGAGNATAVNVSNYGNSTINCTAVDFNSYNTGTITDSLNNSIWNISTNWTDGSNHTKIPSSSQVNFIGSSKSTIIAIDSTKPFYNININKTAAAVCTLSGTTYLKCNGEFRATSGKIYLPCSLSCNSYVNLTNDTIIMAKNKYIATSFYRSSTSRAKMDTSNTYFTGSGVHDISADTGYTMGRFYINIGTANWLTGAKIKTFVLPVASKSVHLAGSVFQVDTTLDIEGTAGNLDTIMSATSGSRFTLRWRADTLGYSAIKDCSSSVLITIDSTCRTLGNNRNIRSMSYYAVNADKSTGIPGETVAITGYGFVGLTARIGTKSQPITTDSYKSATLTVSGYTDDTLWIKNSDNDSVKIGYFDIQPCPLAITSVDDDTIYRFDTLKIYGMFCNGIPDTITVGTQKWPILHYSSDSIWSIVPNGAINGTYNLIVSDSVVSDTLLDAVTIIGHKKESLLSRWFGWRVRDLWRRAWR